MAPYRTPGVYVQELSLLPPSVAEVATAIPAFIGYTEKGYPGVSADPVVAVIRSLLDYEDRFGKAPPTPYFVTGSSQEDMKLSSVTHNNNQVTPGNELPLSHKPDWLLWYAMDHYFRNGGGRCYVVSVGEAGAGRSLSKEALTNGIKMLEKEDEPTLILIPEAQKLVNDINASGRDYFTTVAQEMLKHCGTLKDRFAILDFPLQQDEKLSDGRASYGSNYLAYGAAYYPFLNTTLAHLTDDEGVYIDPTLYRPEGSQTTPATLKDQEVMEKKTDLYNQVKRLLAQQRVILPASPAMAGTYVRVDRERGVWKAPANVGLQAVSGPVHQMTDVEQEEYNIDDNNGKSINAIRSFTGRGTVVWGARTLAGNDNEWKYIPVRRLFITIEESVKKATVFAVFEPNDAVTWLKVKGMIESYLYGLWEMGALQGSKPDHAYFVNVGLGKTMTAQDILEGRLNVEIGIAAVRPAEFIILKFSHRMAQA